MNWKRRRPVRRLQYSLVAISNANEAVSTEVAVLVRPRASSAQGREYEAVAFSRCTGQLEKGL